MGSALEGDGGKRGGGRQEGWTGQEGRGLPRPHWCHIQARVWGPWLTAETGPSEPARVRGERQRVTGSCYAPAKALEKKKVWGGKQLYLESTGTKIARASDQGRQCALFKLIEWSERVMDKVRRREDSSLVKAIDFWFKVKLLFPNWFARVNPVDSYISHRHILDSIDSNWVNQLPINCEITGKLVTHLLYTVCFSRTHSLFNNMIPSNPSNQDNSRKTLVCLINPTMFNRMESV